MALHVISRVVTLNQVLYAMLGRIQAGQERCSAGGARRGVALRVGELQSIRKQPSPRGQVGIGQKKPPRLNPQIEREAWRLLASLERLDAGQRVKLGDELMDHLRRDSKIRSASPAGLDF